MLKVSNLRQSKPDEIAAIELGGHNSRVVVLRRFGAEFRVLKFAVRESPLKQKSVSAETLAEHLKKLLAEAHYSRKQILVVIGMGEALLQRAQMPRAPQAELRQILKFNPGKYFQQDVTQHVFDFYTPPVPPEKSSVTEPPRIRAQADVLIAGAKRDLVDLINRAAKLAHLTLERITVSMLALTDALRTGVPQELEKGPVAVAKIGFSYASIAFLVNSVPVLTRVIEVDGEQLSKKLAEAYNVPRHVPADQKLAWMAAKVRQVLAPLASDFRMAFDFFEAEHEKKISRGFVFGELVVSSLIVEALQDLEIPCDPIDWKGLCTLDGTAEEVQWFNQELPQLVSPIGAAAGWLSGKAIELNLLAEDFEERERRRRDPVRRSAIAAALLVCFLLLWGGHVRFRIWLADSELSRNRPGGDSFEKVLKQFNSLRARVLESQRVLNGLEQHSTNRFACAPVLNALQQASHTLLQVTKVTFQESTANVDAKREVIDKGIRIPRKPAYTTERISVIVQAKNYGSPDDRETFIEHLASAPFLNKALRRDEPIVLKGYLPRQANPLNPEETFNLLTLECMFPERVLGYE